MSFSQGLRAGLDVVSEASHMKQKQEDRQRELDARNSYEQLQKDYYTDQGQFAPTPPSQQSQDMANASYDRVEANRLGVQVPGVQSLSMSPEQRAAMQPQPLDPATKDQLYYKKLGEWAQTHLPADKAMSYMNDLAKFRESNFQQQHTEAFRAAASGDAHALASVAQMYNGLVPDGYHLDTTHAQFDPQSGDWLGVQVANDKGDVKPVNLDHNVLQRLWASTSLPNVLEMRHQLFNEGEAAKKGAREDKRLANDTEALGIRGKVADSAIKKNESEIRQGDARIGLERARVGVENARLGLAQKQSELEGRRIDIAGQELELRKQIAQGDENAKDTLSRQKVFENAFSGAVKPDPLSPTYEQDKMRVEAGKQAAALATSIYQLSAEGADRGKRNRIQAETHQFVLDLDSGRVDGSKLKDNGDGTYAYGSLKLPAGLAQSIMPKGLKAAPQGASGAY